MCCRVRFAIAVFARQWSSRGRRDRWRTYPTWARHPRVTCIGSLGPSRCFGAGWLRPEYYVMCYVTACGYSAPVPLPLAVLRWYTLCVITHISQLLLLPPIICTARHIKRSPLSGPFRSSPAARRASSRTATPHLPCQHSAAPCPQPSPLRMPSKLFPAEHRQRHLLLFSFRASIQSILARGHHPDPSNRPPPPPLRLACSLAPLHATRSAARRSGVGGLDLWHDELRRHRGKGRVEVGTRVVRVQVEALVLCFG